MTPLAPSSEATAEPSRRPYVRGKFIFVGDEKFYVRGLTYGTFRPGDDGAQFPEAEQVERDMEQMAASGANCVRTYTVPPRRLLDAAHRHGLRVLVGIPWEQHVTFLDDRARVRSIEERVREGVRSCAGHPAVLAYAVGNEIPAPVVRWYGHRRVERFLKRLYKVAKSEDPQGLVTYVNYPSTEYLHLPFVDFVSFNVYLEEQAKYEKYLAHLHSIAGDRPLVMAEIGLDSRRNGVTKQSQVLDWMIRAAFASGCAGAFVFKWTDEWYRGGHDIEDWDFGITDRDRRPKPALKIVRRAYAEAPFPANVEWPSVSVVVCSYNGERVIRDCMEGLTRLEYPNFEVIVVDDGSTDGTAGIAEEYGFRVISTENRGLSSARNTGMEAARGEIVAYIDDDAYPDPHWLHYLAYTFMKTDHAGVGGPNIAPPGDGPIADCVANAPGGPIHVLISDVEAEHIPGCNSAFRKSALQAIGGFDARYRVAGDDVDVCWRLQERGWTLGFSPSAVVWHHRRNSVKMYWRQQVGYGRAEALLEQKWPEKYNALGHLAWSGRLYGKGLTRMLGMGRGRIYQGPMGSALFQFTDPPPAGTFWSLPLMPEWYLVICLLAALSSLGYLWHPKLLLLPLLLLAIITPLVQAVLSAAHASFPTTNTSRLGRLKRLALTACLHIMQPLARLRGRLRHGLTPWRLHGVRRWALPRARTFSLWSERWRSAAEWMQSLEEGLRAQGAVVRTGGNYDRWDMEVRCGTLGAVRILTVVEEHGEGKQLLRFRCRPRWSAVRVSLIFLLGALSAVAAYDQALTSAAVLGLTALLLVLRKFHERALSMASIGQALQSLEGEGSLLLERPSAAAAPKIAAPALLELNGNGSPQIDSPLLRSLKLIKGAPHLIPLEEAVPTEPVRRKSAGA